MLRLTTTWTIDYAGPPDNQASPITGIPGEARSYSLTGLANNAWYTVTLTSDPPLLSDTVAVMPTDHIVNLPAVWK